MVDYVAVESFYGGAGSSLEPDSNSSYVGYRLNPAQLGFSTNPTTGDQLSETLRGIRTGAKVIEVNLLRIGIKGGGESDQVIPKQHFKEIRALSKLTGVSPSIHGPLVDAAGFDEQQRVWSEETRDSNERIMFAAMEKARITDPDKNIPVIFHSSNLLGSGTQYTPSKKKEGPRFKEEIVPVLNKETNQLTPILPETPTYLFGEDTKERPFKKMYTPDERIGMQNNTSWNNGLKSLTIEKGYADRALKEALINIKELEKMKRGKQDKEEQYAGSVDLVKAQTLLESNRNSFESLFNQAYKYGNNVQRKELKKMSDDWRFENKKDLKDKKISDEERLILGSGLQDKYFAKLSKTMDPRSEFGGAPKTYVRGEKFAMDEAAKTFGNVATKTYKNLGKGNAPIIAIENVWNGAMFSRGKDMRKLVEKSRNVMVKNLVDSGMDKESAREISKKHIGMNFDLGHLNIFRKKGFTTKDIVGEVKEFAHLIKHMHLTDNFGFSDEHLYPGQANVPFKELFREISKYNPDTEDVKKIVETGGVEARHLGERSAHAFSLAAFGVPIFGGIYGGAPTFDTLINTMGAYSGGYGDINPEIHHSVYGAGFSSLPSELGGIVPGAGTGKSRFGGTPMA